MRRNVRNLSWVLWLVIVAFVAFYIPDLFRGPSNVIARVDGEPIYLSEYQQALQQQTAYYQDASGGSLPDDFLQQIQLEQIVLQSLVRERLILAAARDQGLTVSAREINEQVKQYPAFVENGVFVGRDRYLQVLRTNNIVPEDFETQVATEVLFQKFTEFVSNGVSVSDSEVEDLYQRRNEQVQFDFFVVRAAGLEGEVAELLTDASARTLFEEGIADYRMPEQRSVSYARIETEVIRETVELAEEALLSAYEEGVDEFTVPEQVRARHILFRLPPEPDEAAIAEVRDEAQAILDQIRAGADFAALAETHSADTVTGTAGGDLGWFGRGRMAEEFEQTAFELEPGETSDLVQTTFGFHIIRVDGYRPEQVRPFEEVRPQLEQRITWERAEEMADQRAEEVRMAVLRRASFEELSEQFGLDVQQSPLFTQAGGLADVLSPEFTRQAFVTGRGRISEPIRYGDGFVIFRVDEIVEAHDPEFEEVEAAVRADLIQQLAEERAAEVAQELGERLEQGEAFDVLASEVVAPIRSTELIPRNGVVPDLGREPALVLAAFERGAGEVGGPVSVQQGHALFRVTQHVQPDWGQYATDRDLLRNELLNQRRSGLFESLVRQLYDEYTVVTYEDVLGGIGGVSS